MNIVIRLTDNEIDRLKHGSNIMIPVKNSIISCNVDAIVVKKGYEKEKDKS